MRKRRGFHSSTGFTLLETMIAMAVLVVGVMALAAMLAASIARMQFSQYDFIAQQKSEEAMESIFTAKYNGTANWSQISNYDPVANPGGLFLSTAQPLLQAGADGLVGTAADAGSPGEYILQPGPDGKLGTADDIKVGLSNFNRTITITNVVGEPYVRQILITVTYKSGGFQRSYSLTSYISAF